MSRHQENTIKLGQDFSPIVAELELIVIYYILCYL